MRVTIEIEEKALKTIQKETGLKKKSPAIQKYLNDALRESAKRRFMQRIMNGESDYSLTNEELEARSIYDTY